MDYTKIAAEEQGGFDEAMLDGWTLDEPVADEHVAPMNDDLLSIALGYLQGGLSILPVDENSKRPRPDLLPKDEAGKPSWKSYQTTPPTVDDVNRWFARGCKAVGVVCGQASGGLCVLDFDEPSYYPAWQEAVGDLADGLPVQRTGREGGGYQVAFRCPDPGKNDKLAWAVDDSEGSGRRIAIETRANGGYVCLPGSLHPSGRRYEVISGDWSNIPTISQVKAEALLSAARKLDRCPLTRQQQDAAEQRAKLEAEERAERNGESVIDLFNERNPIRATLERFGYKRAGARYHRPGAPAGLPASVVIFDDGRSFHHDSDDPMSDGHAHRSFDVFCHFEHAGDTKAAVRAAAVALGIAYKQNGKQTSGTCDTIAKNTGKRRVVSQTRNVTSWKPFPVESLPEPLAGFAKAAGEALGCDPAFVAVPQLGALGGAIGATVQIELKESWREPAVIWAATVADPGTQKSPALDLACGPIRRAQAFALSEYPALLDTYRRDLACFEADMGEWKRNGRKKGEPPPERPEEPQPRRYVYEDTTVEALAIRLLHNPRGGVVCVDELAGWLNSFGVYKANGKSGDVQKWLSMHRAGPMIIDRKTGSTLTVFIPRAAMSICGTVQPETLRRALGSEHFANGLASRLLLCLPPKKPKKWTNKVIPVELQRQVDRVFSRLLGFGFRTNQDGQEEPITLRLSPEGQRAWIDFYDVFGKEQATLTGDEAAAAAKLEAYAARLALIVHLVRVCADDPSVDTELVDAQSVASGVTLCRWFQNEASRVYGVFSETDEDTKRRRLVELVHQQGGQITARDLQRIRHLGTVEDADALLDDLAKAGLGGWEAKTHDGPGRPAATFRIVSQDARECDTNSVNPEENGNCVTNPGQDIDEINRRW